MTLVRPADENLRSDYREFVKINDAVLHMAIAALMGRHEAAEFLLKNGADPIVVTVLGTPTDITATLGRVDVVRLLIELSSVPTGRQIVGVAPVKYSLLLGAIKSVHLVVVALLLESSSNPDRQLGSSILSYSVFQVSLKQTLEATRSDEITVLSNLACEAYYE